MKASRGVQAKVRTGIKVINVVGGPGSSEDPKKKERGGCNTVEQGGLQSAKLQRVAESR